eukprot:scaffold284586_cov43-Attheya_sp.AAC.1
MQTVTQAQLMGLKKYRLHIPAEHLNEKERKEKQRRNTRMSVREQLHYENEVKDTLKEEWEHDMMAEHAKMKLGFYDKFESFLELARAIKKPYTRKCTYESSQTNKVETEEVMYDNNKFRSIPESVLNAAKKIIIGLDEKGAGSGKRINQYQSKGEHSMVCLLQRGGACLNAAINWERTSKRGRAMRMKVRRKNSPKRLIT